MNKKLKFSEKDVIEFAEWITNSKLHDYYKQFLQTILTQNI